MAKQMGLISACTRSTASVAPGLQDPTGPVLVPGNDKLSRTARSPARNGGALSFLDKPRFQADGASFLNTSSGTHFPSRSKCQNVQPLHEGAF